MQDKFLANHRVSDDLRDELVANICKCIAMRAGHVVDRAVAHVLEGSGHSGRAVVLEHRDRDNLVERFRHELAEVRSVLSIVLRVIAVRNQVHPDKRVVVKTRDGIVAEVREIHRELIRYRVQAAPAHAVRQDLVVAGVHELTAIAIVDKDVPGLDAGRLELLDHFEDDLERRVGFGLAVGNDFDADDIARLKEVLPGLNSVGGPSQFFHAFFEGGLDGGGVANSALAHRRVTRLDDPAGVKPRRSQLAQGLHVSAMMGNASLDLRGLGQRASAVSAEIDGNGRSRRAEELPPAQACEGAVMIHGFWSFPVCRTDECRSRDLATF